MNATADTSRATAPKDALPFEVVVCSPSIRATDRYATEEEAYAEARRIRDERAHSDTVVFRSKFGHTGRYAVGRIDIRRWNPITQRWAAHAQPWSRNSPNPAALTPLPRDWHGDQLPADWYADPTA